jgi:hypothetical protein
MVAVTKNPMGGGTDRKGKDRTFINKPKGKQVEGNGGGGGGGGGSSSGGGRDKNQICPPAFDVLIHPKQKLTDGTSLTVKGAELFVLGERIGKLSPKQEATIKECLGLGLRYMPKVKGRGDNIYARFERAIG